MADFWNNLESWFLSLGEEYGVDPIVFGSIYVGAIPFFTLSVAWVVRNYRRKKSIVWPVLSSAFFFVSAYLYLFMVGKNIPGWVYFLLAAMLLYGAYTTFRSTRRKALAARNSGEDDASGS